MSTHHSATKNGFTLIELLVSVALFSVVIMIGIGSLLSMVAANKKAESIKSVMNNLNAAVEQMSRTIRVGAYYHCGSTGTLTTPQDCVTGDTYFGFLPAGENPNLSDNRTIYRFNATDAQIERSLDSGASWVSITAPEVRIENLTFYTIGTDTQRATGDVNQPRVLMVVQGIAGEGAALQSPFQLETMVSQRLLDI